MKGNTVAEHDENLLAVIMKLKNSGYTINYPKCVIRKQQVEFLQSHDEIDADEYVNFLAYESIPKTVTLHEIVAATSTDIALQLPLLLYKLAAGMMQRSMPTVIKYDMTESFDRVQNELTVMSDGSYLLRGTRLVIPRSLLLRVVKVTHAGHMGLVKTKQLTREKVRFPGVDKLTSDLIANCIACQATVPAKQSREPYNMSPLPNGPRMEVSVDFKVLPTSEYLSVITDDYSRYPIVETITSTAAKVVIPVIDKVFAEFGVPHTLESGNGSPFQSDDFAKYANYLGFKHRRITPYWPRANAECERFMKTLGKCIKAATAEVRSYKQNLHAFLFNYRATPHPTTGISPAIALSAELFAHDYQN